MTLHKNAINMVGQLVGKLTVIELAGRAKRGIFWRCSCECGNQEYQATTGDLRSGRITSCGCYRTSAEFAEKRVTHGQNRKHHGKRSGAYSSWADIKKRCRNPNSTNYAWYGGRGISYHPDWEYFINFYADMGDRPEGLELDRIDNQGDYNKANCRWVTHRVNCQNRG